MNLVVLNPIINSKSVWINLNLNVIIHKIINMKERDKFSCTKELRARDIGKCSNLPQSYK